MGRPRQPVAVVQANGRKHLTQAEIAAREATEVRVPKAVRIKPPKWLPETLRPEYRRVARQLLDVGLYTDLDEGVLGRYVIALHEYLQAVDRVQEGFAKGDHDKVNRWGRAETRYLDQCQACAREMGLTISARCALVVPMAVPAVSADPDDDLFGD